MFFISVLVFPSIKPFEPLLLDVDQQPHIHKKQKTWDQFRVLYILYIIYIKVLYIIWKPCLWRYRKFGHISGSIFSRISTYYRKYGNSCNDLTYFDWVTVTTKIQFLLAKELITILEKKKSFFKSNCWDFISVRRVTIILLKTYFLTYFEF